MTPQTPLNGEYSGAPSNKFSYSATHGSGSSSTAHRKRHSLMMERYMNDGSSALTDRLVARSHRIEDPNPSNGRQPDKLSSELHRMAQEKHSDR